MSTEASTYGDAPLDQDDLFEVGERQDGGRLLEAATLPAQARVKRADRFQMRMQMAAVDVTETKFTLAGSVSITVPDVDVAGPLLVTLIV